MCLEFTIAVRLRKKQRSLIVFLKEQMQILQLPCKHKDLAHNRDFIQYGFVKGHNYMSWKEQTKTTQCFKCSLATSKTVETVFIT